MTSTTVAEACRKTLSGGSRRNVMRQPEAPGERTQWSLFSMAQWPRTQAAMRSGLARSGVALVMPSAAIAERGLPFRLRTCRSMASVHQRSLPYVTCANVAAAAGGERCRTEVNETRTETRAGTEVGRAGRPDEVVPGERRGRRAPRGRGGGRIGAHRADVLAEPGQPAGQYSPALAHRAAAARSALRPASATRPVR